MQRYRQTYKPNNIDSFKKKLLQWANQYSHVCFLESNTRHQLQKNVVDEYDSILAVGLYSGFESNNTNSFQKLQHFLNNTNDWIFGNLCYDLKNEIENLNSNNSDNLFFENIYFFQPEYVFIQIGNDFQLQSIHQDKQLFEAIEALTIEDFSVSEKVELIPRLNEKEYSITFDKIKEQIQAGNIYEMNFCFEFYAENVSISPVDVWFKLNELSHAPMSCFYKLNDKFIISATPERFLKKKNQKVIAQPIKGTAKRSSNQIEDELIKQSLAKNMKEQTENIMIVDLVRNDLSRVSKARSVKVDELFGVYTFKQVHQLISTISCDVDASISVSEIIKQNFPMGSMTGAPKISAMQLIDEFENTKRGAYSGSVGYFNPNGDFDFNVVIRSLLYNQQNKYLSYSVGSAITIAANANEEYNECLLKAKVIKSLFN
jgi:para-aminobenzoate synthetase component 1